VYNYFVFQGFTTPKTNQKCPGNSNTTPPVKDPGPGENIPSAQKLDHMKQMLKELEDAKNRFTNSKSRIPRRSLNFPSTSNSTSQSVVLSADLSKKSVDDQFKEMNEFLDKFKGSASSSQKSNSSKNSTVIEAPTTKTDNSKAIDELKELNKQLKTEIQHRKVCKIFPKKSKKIKLKMFKVLYA
jgi:hypothetical protein